MSRIAAIVQARLGSTRLPLKSLVCLRGQPIIDWVVDRLHQSHRLDTIMVAVPATPLDQVLLQHLQSRGEICMTGPENDVLTRFVMAADLLNVDVIVRVCADNPLIWAPAVDALIDFYENNSCDYAWNHIPRNNLWPDGLGAEIVSSKLLHGIANAAILPAQREHCFNYIWDNSEKFRMATFDPVEPWLRRPEVKLDIDSIDDYVRMARLATTPAMGARDIIAAWDEQIAIKF